jgi:hypothetical protein
MNFIKSLSKKTFKRLVLININDLKQLNNKNYINYEIITNVPDK